MTMMKTRFGGNGEAMPTGELLPADVPHGGASLPSLTSALSRRAALFGAVAVASVTAPAYALAREPAVTSSAAADAALIDLAQEVESLGQQLQDLWDRHADIDAEIEAALPAFVPRPEAPSCSTLTDTTENGLRTISVTMPVEPDAEHAAIMAIYNARIAERDGLKAAVGARLGLPELEERIDRTSEHLRCLALDLSEMTASSMLELAVKASAMLAVLGRGGGVAEMAVAEHEALALSVLREAAAFGTLSAGARVA